MFFSYSCTEEGLTASTAPITVRIQFLQAEIKKEKLFDFFLQYKNTAGWKFWLDGENKREESTLHICHGSKN